MSPTDHYDQGDLALFAMQLLSRNEHSSMEVHISDCTYCRQELAQLQGDLATYAQTVEMHSPPAMVRDRLLHQVGREKRVSPAERIEEEYVEPPPVTRYEPVNRVERMDRVERPERIDRTDRQERIDRSVRQIRQEPPERQERPSRVERIEAAAAADSVPTFGYTPRQKYATGLGSGRYLDEEDAGDLDAMGLGRLFTRVFPWLGWAAAAGMAVVAGNLYHERESQRTKLAAQAATIDRLNADTAGAKQLLETATDATARQATLTQAQGEPASTAPMGRVIYIASKGSLIFLGSNLEPVPTYKTYELWLIPVDGRDPIPAGTFRPDAKGNASVILPPLPKGIEAKVFGITIEDEGGSQTPTMPIVLAGG